MIRRKVHTKDKVINVVMNPSTSLEMQGLEGVLVIDPA